MENYKALTENLKSYAEINAKIDLGLTTTSN